MVYQFFSILHYKQNHCTKVGKIIYLSSSLVSFAAEDISSLSTTLIMPFFHMMREEMMAIGSMNKIKNPIAPKRESPLVILKNRDKTVTIAITGRTGKTKGVSCFVHELAIWR